MKINYLDPSLFKDMKLEDSLEIDYHQSLEKDIAQILKGLKIQNKDLKSYKDDEIEKLLLNLFLRLSGRKSWKDSVRSGIVGKEELYLIVKKHLYYSRIN